MEHLFGVVGDVQHGGPALAEHGQEVLKLLHVLGPDARGRLVHHHQAGGEAGELGELHELLQRRVQQAHRPIHVHVELDGPQRGGKLLSHAVPVVEEEEGSKLAIHEDVFHRAQAREEPGFAVHRENSQAHGVARRVPLHRPPGKDEPPGGPRNQSGDDLHERRFPRALDADHGVDLSSRQAQADVLERHAAVLVRAHPFQEKDRIGGLK